MSCLTSRRAVITTLGGAAFGAAFAGCARANDLAPEHVEHVFALLEGAYRDPEIGAAAAAIMRRNWAAGAYRGSALGVAAALEGDARAATMDRVLRIRAAGAAPDPASPWFPAPGAPPNYVSEGEDAPAVLTFSVFGSDAQSKEALSKVLALTPPSRLLLDLRGARGAHLDLVSLLADHLFAAPTPLMDIAGRSAAFARIGDPFARFASKPLTGGDASLTVRRHVAAPAPGVADWSKVAIATLVDATTQDAAAYLAAALQWSGRSPLIGAATRGASSFGAPLSAGPLLRCFIPIAEARKPGRAEAWDRHGLSVDVACEPHRAIAAARAALA